MRQILFIPGVIAGFGTLFAVTAGESPRVIGIGSGITLAFLLLNNFLPLTEREKRRKREEEIEAQIEPRSIESLRESNPGATDDTLRELQAYDMVLQKASLTGEPTYVANGSSGHAGILFSALLEGAKRRACIVAGESTEEILMHPKVLSSLEDCLARGVEVEILFMPKASIASKRLRELYVRPDTPLNLHQGSEATMSVLWECGKGECFSVFDGRSYRLEKASQAGECEAEASFNSKDEAEFLTSLFEALLSSAEKLEAA